MQSIIELSRTQDEEVGDGTTSVIILGACQSLQCKFDIICAVVREQVLARASQC